MTSHDLAKLLLSLPDTTVNASIDMSTDESNADNRVFGYNLFEVSDLTFSANEVILIFETGFKNY